MTRSVLLALLPVLLTSSSVFVIAQTDLTQIDYADVEAQRREPFKMFDNLYYVGVQRVGAHLITTTEGLILLDATYDHLANQVLENVRTLGFDPGEIRYILISHGHNDHAGGARRIQQVTGAKIAIGEGDAETLARGSEGGTFPFPGVTPDLRLKDGDEITLGDTKLQVHLTPGHTPGTISLEWTVYDDGTPRKALFFGGPGVNAQDLGAFMDSVRCLQRIDDAEVLVLPHPFLENQFGRAARLALREAGDPNPFVAPDQNRAFLASLIERAKRRTQVR